MRDNDKMRLFAKKTILWQQQHGRHDLPWQNTRDPYPIWVSEIMLQQTQVSAVVGYFTRFMARFPDIAALSRASIDEVMPYWAGLGYYARARNLHKAALIIRDRFAGVFPSHFEDVLALPGIGRSTAAAICVFAHDHARPILDGNVKRVFARYFGVTGDIRSKAVENQMWAIAEREAPTSRVAAYIQGQMDLGATICVRRAPDCPLCPLRRDCVAHQTNRVNDLPARITKKPRPHRELQMLVLLSAEAVLLEKRPSAGIWGGLWSLPEAPRNDNVRALAKTRFGITLARGRKPQALSPIEHGFTHYTLTIHPVVLRVGGIDAVSGTTGTLWLNLDDVSGAALPAPVKKILLQL